MLSFDLQQTLQPKTICDFRFRFQLILWSTTFNLCTTPTTDSIWDILIWFEHGEQKTRTFFPFKRNFSHSSRCDAKIQFQFKKQFSFLFLLSFYLISPLNFHLQCFQNLPTVDIDCMAAPCLFLHFRSRRSSFGVELIK